MTAFSLPSELDLSPDQLFGYLACALVLTTFAMRSMQGLRYVAILSNIAFIYYAGALGLMPIFILHAVLLPLNLWRLVELWSNTSIARQDKENKTRGTQGMSKSVPGSRSVGQLVLVASQDEQPKGFARIQHQ